MMFIIYSLLRFYFFETTTPIITKAHKHKDALDTDEISVVVSESSSSGGVGPGVGPGVYHDGGSGLIIWRSDGDDEPGPGMRVVTAVSLF
jgi:hypothetical protein